MKSTTRSITALTLTAASLVAVLLFFAIRSNRQHMESPTQDRAANAPALRPLTEGLERVAVRQSVYVPVYSHVYAGRTKEVPLVVTLSLRNTDAHHSIVIELIQYFDNDGNLLRDYIEAPVVLGPFASTDFLVEQRDMAGGVGANFLVNWVSEQPVSQPIFEAVMLGGEGNRGYAFVRPGYPVATSPAED